MRVFRLAFTVRRSRLVLGTLVVGLALPATTMAALPDQIKTKATNAGSHGFKLSLFIQQGQPGNPYDGFPNEIVGTFFRHAGKGTENDSYAFFGVTGHPLKFKKGRKALQFAHITGTFANGGGSVNLTFHATGPARHVNVPKGCTGNAGQRRPGTLSGSFALHADKLGTITKKSFNATISTASVYCHTPTHGYDLQTSGANHAYVDVFKPSGGGPVFEQIYAPVGIGDGWTVNHSYTVSGLPSSDFKLNTSKLNSGRVTGGGGISGSATYIATQSRTHHTTGTMSGSLAVTFASIGKLTALLNGRRASESHS